MKKKREFMIGNIDLLANRVLYAIYEVWVLLTRLLAWLFDWTFGRPMYSIPFVRKRINKVNGVKEYESFKKGLEIPKTAFLPNKLVFFVFFLPISLLFNIVTIVVGSPLTLLYCTFPYPFIMITIIMALSILLCHYFYERDNRYIVFFNRFEKDSLLKRVVWVIGTFFAFILLLALNLKLMFNIIDMGRHQTFVLH